MSAAEEILDPLTDLEREVLSGLLDALVDGAPGGAPKHGHGQGPGPEQGQGRTC